MNDALPAFTPIHHERRAELRYTKRDLSHQLEDLERITDDLESDAAPLPDGPVRQHMEDAARVTRQAKAWLVIARTHIENALEAHGGNNHGNA